VAIAGIVVGYESKLSRNGKPFGIFSIEDFSGATEMVLWGEDFLRYKHFLESGSMLFIKGKYQLRFNSDDRWELKISSVQLLQDVREKNTKRVSLAIPLNEVSEELILKMANLLTKYKGSYPVAIRVEDLEQNVALNFAALKSGVNLSEEFMTEVANVPEVEIRLL
jgi:DNA polymerase-3 subunit alpha